MVAVPIFPILLGGLSKEKPNDKRSWHSKNVGFRFTQPNPAFSMDAPDDG